MTTTLAADAAHFASRGNWKALLVLSDAAEEAGDDWLADRMRKVSHLIRVLTLLRADALHRLQSAYRSATGLEEAIVLSGRIMLVAHRRVVGEESQCRSMLGVQVTPGGPDSPIHRSGWRRSMSAQGSFDSVSSLAAGYLRMGWKRVFDANYWRPGGPANDSHRLRWETLIGGLS